MFWQTGGEDMTRVGVIGVGGMGFTHVKALKSLAEEMDLQVVAIADLHCAGDAAASGHGKKSSRARPKEAR